MAIVAPMPITKLMEAYYGELRSFVRRKTGNPSVAEDLVQEACLRFASADVSRIENPRAFLYRVATNLVIDHRRKEGTRARYLQEDGGELDAVDEISDLELQLVAKQRLAILARAIEELPPRCRECFIMRRFQDLDHSEIARRMGISRNMVEKHLRLAVVHCAQRVREGD